MKRKIAYNNGIEIFLHDKKILLDPKYASSDAFFSFVSHAHFDHIPRKVSGNLVLTKETACLLSEIRKIKNICYSFFFDSFEVRLLNSGHMLGASQIFIENEVKICYTGDFNLRGGFTAGKPEIRKCDVLIMEATFGRSCYSFPDKEEVAKQIADWAEECFSKNKRPAILAYKLGKAQEIIKVLSSKLNIAVSKQIHAFCEKYAKLGIKLGKYYRYSEEICEKNDFLCIFPTSFSKYKASENFVKAIASGWAVHDRARHRYNAEHGFVFSDHSDFYDLISFAEKCSPSVIYTVHGFAEELASELRALGFYAEALS